MIVALASAFAFAALLVAPFAPQDPDFDGEVDEVEGTLGVDGSRDKIRDHADPGVDFVSLRPREYLRSPACDAGTPVGNGDVCSPLAAIAFECPAGMTPRMPLWVRQQADDGTWSPWTLLVWYTCPSEADLLALVEREWTELRPEPSRIALQPGDGRVYATVPTIAMADDSPQLHSAVLLGAEVDIRATPANYTWHWGDGETTTTSDPGAPHPNATVTHAYGRALDEATVSLTTTWAGEYRVAGGAWIAFDTVIDTSSPGVGIEVLHPRARLVASNN
ncbi:MAG: hypothetical protein ACLGHM_03610 [Actinomycetes bacterium]